MDYGYQLLRHVVQQVLGNLRQAAQLTLLLFLTPIAGFIALGGDSIGTSAPPGGGVIAGGLLLVVVAIVAYCWAAVGWHRYVLLEETGNGLLPPWRGDRIGAYFGRAFVVGLVVILAVFGASIAVGVIGLITQSFALSIVLGIGLVFGASWIATRIGLVLPAAALGARMTIAESWAITRPVSGHILLPLIVIALGVGLIQQLILVIFGQGMPADAFPGPDAVTLSLPGQLLNAILSWLQLLFNLALMTTLYGNLVEGRQLN